MLQVACTSPIRNSGYAIKPNKDPRGDGRWVSLILTKCWRIAYNPEFIASLNAENGSLIVWLDYMKCGVVSNDDLNNSASLLAKALGALPERSVGFVIAPFLQSERRSGMRDELRRGILLPNQW